MKAAVIHSYTDAPNYEEYPTPTAEKNQKLIKVEASALSQLVKIQAQGKHYSSTEPPFVVGVDGVGTLDNGKRVYFAFPTKPLGSFSEYTVVNADNVAMIPDHLDSNLVAALANPGMSSWAALKLRAQMQPGETVLINGATGASGRLAIQIAKHFQAGKIIVTGRNAKHEQDLKALGADEFILLGENEQQLKQQFLSQVNKGVHIVLDYLWGPSASLLLQAISEASIVETAPDIRFVNIGSLGGKDIALPAGVLRSGRLSLLGSGLGSVSNKQLVACIEEMLTASQHIDYQIEYQARPIAELTNAWQENTNTRLVFTL